MAKEPKQREFFPWFLRGLFVVFVRAPVMAVLGGLIVIGKWAEGAFDWCHENLPGFERED